MAKYKITSPEGKSLTISGETPPSKEQIQKIFQATSGASSARVGGTLDESTGEDIQPDGAIRQFINKTNLGVGIPALSVLPTSGAELGDFVKNAIRFVAPAIPDTSEAMEGTPFAGSSTSSLVDRLTKPNTQYGKNLQTATNVAGLGLLAYGGGKALLNKWKGRFEIPSTESIEEMGKMANREFQAMRTMKGAAKEAEESLIQKLYSDQVSDVNKEVDLTKESIKDTSYKLQNKGKDEWFKFHKKLNDEFGAKRNALVDNAGIKADSLESGELIAPYERVVKKYNLDMADPAFLDPKEKQILATYKKLKGEDVEGFEMIGDFRTLDNKVRSLRNNIRGKQFNQPERVQNDLAYELDKLMDKKIPEMKPLRSEYKERYKFKNEAWNIFNPTKDEILDRKAYGIFKRVGEGKPIPQDTDFLTKVDTYFGGDFTKPIKGEAAKLKSLSERIANISANREVDLASYGRNKLNENMRDVEEYNNLIDTITATAKNKKAQERIQEFVAETGTDIATGGHSWIARRAVKGLF